MKILKMELSRFKGIKNFIFAPRGQSATIYGQNAAGKTTLFDAWTWLLFDRDSLGRKDFALKALDADGNPLHGLSHEVKAELAMTGGETLALRKVYAEKWTKKRGAPQAEFTGHTTDHYIDGVPTSKKEYDARIILICDEQKFRLLTDPAYLCEHMHWQARRKLLLDVCGDITDTDVITQTPALKDLPGILGKRSADDLRKILQARRAEANRELDKLPVRIDEVQRGIPDAQKFTPDQVGKDIGVLETARAEALAQREQVLAGGGVAEKTRQLRDAESKLIAAKNAQISAIHERVSGLKVRQSELRAEQMQVEALIRIETQAGGDAESRAKVLEPQIAALREEWMRVHAETLTPQVANLCPTCGQYLPAEAVQDATAKALADFNTRKASRLEVLSHEGKAKKQELDTAWQKIAHSTAETERLRQKNAELIEEAKRLGAKIAQESEQPPTTEMLQAQEQIRLLTAELEAMRKGSTAETEHLDAKLQEMDKELAELRMIRARIEQRRFGEERIAELKLQQKQLGAEMERIERELHLMDEFVRAKVSLLEDKINSRFRLARFKLFETQVNGAIAECCEATYDGVPYGSGLNRGMRINLGLDIINTLAEHYGFTPPVWIDNAEAVVDLLPTAGQQIRLVVSGGDKQLRIETL